MGKKECFRQISLKLVGGKIFIGSKKRIKHKYGYGLDHIWFCSSLIPRRLRLLFLVTKLLMF
jgi:hypothetical protein